jgi:aryl-alcohol dehydrogenase-like predicted oxidoreductase
VINGSPFAHGLLIGEDPDRIPAAGGAGSASARRRARLYHWCREKGGPMTAVVLQFCLREPRIGCTLTGAKNRAELEENLRAATRRCPRAFGRNCARSTSPRVRSTARGGRPRSGLARSGCSKP